MKHTRTGVRAAALVALSVESYAQGVDIGKREYANSCAVCHGDSGRGDGPIVGYLKAAPTDLTIIEKNNKGVFPFGRVYDVIDGRTAIPAHGPRDMPIWGDQFKEYNAELAKLALKFNSPIDSEAFLRDRILALISGPTLVFVRCYTNSGQRWAWSDCPLSVNILVSADFFFLFLPHHQKN